MLKKLLSLLSDAAIYGTSRILSQLISFLLLPLYVRFLTPADYGIVAMLGIVMLLFGPLANLGMPNAVFRRFNQAKDDDACRVVLGTGFITVVFGAIVVLAVTLAFAPWIAAHFVGAVDTTHLVRLCLLSAAINTVALVPSVTLRARRRVKLAAGLNLAGVLVAICTSVWFVAVKQMGVLGWVYGVLAADAALLVMAFAATWRLFDLHFNRTVWRSMISYGLPLVPHRLQAIALAQFSLFMVRDMLGLGETGIYLVATKFALPVGLLVNAVQEAWIPFKFQMHAQETDARPFFRSMFTYYFGVVTYLWVGVSLWGFDVVRLMTTPEFYAAAYLVPVLALLRVSQGVYFMMGTGIELTDRTGAYPLISLAGLVTVVSGAFILISPFGAFGAAFAAVIGWLLMAAIMYYFAQQRYGIDYDWPTIGFFALLAVACIGLGYAVQPAALWMRLAVYLAVSIAYPLVVLLLLVRSPTERDRVRILFMKFRAFRGLKLST